MELAIFPLPVYLLPGGVTQLRIFEPRYVRMVSESFKHGNGFVICVYLDDEEYNVPDWGARVEIIDFEQGKDGILHIKVRSEELVDIGAVCVETDGLRKAKCSSRAHWPDLPMTEDAEGLSALLKEVLTNVDVLNKNYVETDYDNLSWVCRRWLELIPIPMEDKLKFASFNSIGDAKTFLLSILKNDIRE